MGRDGLTTAPTDTMQKTLLAYVKPHVQEDPVAQLLGLTYLGACLEKENIPIELVDERIVNDQYMREAIDRNDVIGFSSLTPNIRRAIAWAKYAKERGKTTIMGGPHATVDHGIFLDSGHFDWVLKGECEYTFAQFLKAIDGGDEKEISEVPGLCGAREGEVWLNNPTPPLLKVLDDIPLPARHMLPMDRYFALNPERLVYIFTTRGCPFKCIFCQKELHRSRLPRALDESICRRARVPDRKTYDPGVILFVDEILTLRRAHPRDVRRDPAPWSEVRVDRQYARDCVDYPLLKHMHRAGCRRIYYGWETGSQRMLDTLKKDMTAEQVVESARMTRRAGIWAKVYLIVGSPGESVEDIKETEKVLRVAGPDLIRISVFNPLIGTESWDNYQASIDISDLSENYVSSNRSAYKHENFTQIELEELRKQMVRNYERWYYSYPARGRRIFERSLYYLENPEYFKKRIGRAFGLVQRDRSVLVQAD